LGPLNVETAGYKTVKKMLLQVPDDVDLVVHILFPSNLLDTSVMMTLFRMLVKELMKDNLTGDS